jgi:large conductance mechanosensitive channel
VTKLLRDFKRFLFRGNVMDLAVAVVVGTAFTAVVKALVADILTPVIAAIFGAHNFANLKFTVHHSTFAYGDFINNMITFLSVAAAMFFLVVTPINALMARRAKEDPDTKQCPECDRAIPVKARRCPECTSELGTVTA